VRRQSETSSWQADLLLQKILLSPDILNKAVEGFEVRGRLKFVVEVILQSNVLVRDRDCRGACHCHKQSEPRATITTTFDGLMSKLQRCDRRTSFDWRLSGWDGGPRVQSSSITAKPIKSRTRTVASFAPPPALHKATAPPPPVNNPPSQSTHPTRPVQHQSAYSSFSVRSSHPESSLLPPTPHSIMAAVSLLNVAVRNNPAAFDAPYEFEITFECLETLSKDLEWKLTYVGSATS